MENLLQAARDQIRTALSLTANQCDLQPEGRPPARMGDTYIALDELGIVAGEKTHIKEVFTIGVWITKATGRYAKDNSKAIFLEGATGLRALERKVIVALHGVQAVRAAANAYANAPDASYGDIYQQPLWYGGRPATRYAGGDWVGSPDGDDRTFAYRVLRFTGGTRVQALDTLH